LLFSIL
jgi:hypothetical protein